MTRKIVAIVFIFICTSVAWAILGTTIFARTYDSEAASSSRVASTWGTQQNQGPPAASYITQITKNQDVVENGKTIKKTWAEALTNDVPLETSKINVDLDLQHRQKGLLWYSTYKVRFAGVYGFRNPTDKEQTLIFRLQFPTAQAIYDDLTFTIDGNPATLTNENNAAKTEVKIGAGKTAQLSVGYSSQGLNEWRYSFGGGSVAQVKDFNLQMTTNFKDIDFPDNTLSPSEKHETSNGWSLNWSYKNLLSGYQIAMVMPEKLQPGPLAGRISFFAPVSLFFFFFLMLIITTMRGIDLHPMNYFFLAAAFFSFHLLMAYLVDHVSIHAAFAISSAVSIFLVISYLRLVVGIGFASREAALAQFVYLVMFSYAFFLKGFTGLAITIGSVVTLFIVMQITGRIQWAEKFAVKSRPEPAAEMQ
ncbi:MAG: inner membrane CreD family protein [Acidobacteria bacterium]|nr:inner membrane CreD family protein [Acidobacteriota bacterium]MCA1627439.1 inner membrane CreD family protein [Acidobacteriota bacterium]